ncbi:2-amino-4-hydroxy-6-hydroxymethyldihydropteridine diphosphokinase [Corynebacterium sanguinis]|uniref:2-amino-4-hydroxy-6-hydroxymethyldihydropteridine diphosphokinase n=1 Tax=Corynebacterium sanguinis TaxID=2594913 RepID=A0A6C1TZ47_9CORY|nr:2-amino-4-hydroxy-6-hydroxymethyldihydropteridine diphosphokinase [Corynebacterium sanguinis]MBA4503791.1 2-amino-4-hydroxy-6-hydroxymethyldihydropteridine diphosphokinase [Corynebacterium sanguinis]MCT1463068.1 2-amino-4-hydroxy-6-hydroxymethyldihydropteridine diphosphokinase [Corynebacterium sanguinis]MCT1596844.1 2-amino-4-hydroxy-6-hydroxymethyldihydropteridine diphosphokinase [Corynebacterium sanguinis]MCT2287761.1 2-amino-4-hydroxy-6-hydroxymethyldihydropteridine diphosphokinase [Coryn
MRAVLSTGSNMEDSRAHLASVVDEFAAELVAASSLYATAPWGGVEQDDFLNQVLIVDVEQSPRELLRRCQSLEQRARRVRKKRWGPRTLDVDIVLIDGFSSRDPELTVPHPRAHERAFVLVPWLEIDPDAHLGHRSVAGIVDKLGAEGVRKL